MSDKTEKKENFIFKERIYPVLFMIIVTVIFITAVSGLYLATEDIVKLNETLFQKKAVLYAANIPIPDLGEAVETLYNERVQEIEAAGTAAFLILNESGATDGVVVFSEGPGLWGEIQAVVGYHREGKTLSGVEFTKQNETPGLGARISENWFREQFRNKTPPFIMVPEGTSKTDNEMDAITGATRTSAAVLKIMNSSAETARKVLEDIK